MRKRALFAILAACALMLSLAVPAWSTVTESGFQDDDGNLVLDTGEDVEGDTDWNSFHPVTWTGTAPNRVAEGSANGWKFEGTEDWQNSNSDNAFVGGTKQDTDCAGVTTQKANNKTDLKRIYLASKIIDEDVFLMLAWSRIPQNTTSPSANVAFEFNQGTTACPGTAGGAGLVRRTVDDLLIVYDFLGGDDIPTLNIARWVGSGSCEISSNSPPCWGPYEELESPTTEARVNTFGSVVDGIAPPGPGTNETLGTKEFGEAGVNLTDAGVFGAQGCTTFGTNFAVSRTSGNSANAQMKDLVKTSFTLSNCGSILVEKVDEDGNLLEGAGFTVTPGQTNADGTVEDSSEMEEFDDGVFCLDDLALGVEYTVSETTVPEGYEGAEDQTFTPTEVSSCAERIGDEDDPDLTFENVQEVGAIEVTKTRKFADDGSGNQPHPGVTFEVYEGDIEEDEEPVASGETDEFGVVCFEGLSFGDYTVKEVVPDGYVSDDEEQDATVDTIAGCGDEGQVELTFHNDPLTDVDVTATSQDPGATHSHISCVDESDTEIGNSGEDNGAPEFTDPAELSLTDLVEGTYVCTIVIDP